MDEETSNAGADRESAVEWLLSDKHPKLLPTPWLSPYEFEEFLERLLRAERYLGAEVRHVVKVERWGTSGDKQDGVDLVGEYSDGTPATWQCKHLEKLRPFEVKAAVEEATYQGAEEFYLVFSRVASSQARAEMKKHAGWTLLDRRQLTAMLRELPSQVQRDILDQTWGEEVRRLFLEAPGDAFVSLETFVSVRRNPDAVMNDLGPLMGREDELTALEAAFDRNSDRFRQVVILSGPAGRGKSRLVSEALTALQERQPGVPVVCLAAGHRFQAAAMDELRMGPAVILIDDAHADPAALGPLLAFARQRTDVQLVFATRPSGLSGIVEQLMLANFSLAEHTTLSVGMLGTRQARQLVKSLTEGMSLPFPLKNYLAQQAEHSPFVTVITANLIKRGELTKSLAVDDGLRTQILSRYREVRVDVEGYSTQTIQRVLATYAALGPVKAGDQALMAQIAEFCGLKPIDLARLLKGLRDRGVLVEYGEVLRVVPDVLADHLLEAEAAFEDYDSGFVAELWDRFGQNHHHQLALSLSELDWRLVQRGGPRIMGQVWSAIRTRLQMSDYELLVEELARLEQLAATQPAELVAILEELRARLDREDDEGIKPREDDKTPSYRKLLGLPPITRDDVRAKMPNLYARAALNDSDQLKVSLDALWALRRRDGRSVNSHTDHPERMLTEHLGNLATLPDGSYPQRIVTRVSVWLNEPGQLDDATTPLFALAPLLAKEGLVTAMSSTRQIELEPRTINASRVREVRDQIREVLLAQALATDMRRVGEALELLRTALRQPHGYFNQTIGSDTILQWEDDDLATLEVFSQIAARTAVPAVRRRIHDHIEWSANHAASLKVRHTALTLMVRLDSEAGLEDDVADQALDGNHGIATTKVLTVPSPEELEAARAAEHERLTGMTEEERQADTQKRVRHEVEAGMALQQEHLADLATRLLGLNDIAAMVDLLDETVRPAQALRHNPGLLLWALWHQIAEQAPDRLEVLIRNIADRPLGPLHEALPLLTTRWLQHAPATAATWIQDNVVNGRPEVKLILARGFNDHGWHHLGDPFPEIWSMGANDPNPNIAQAYLMAAGGYLREQPAAAVEVLLNLDISQANAARVTENASNYQGRAFGTALGTDDAAAVLRLIAHAGHDSYAAQETLAEIARTHPQLILDYLADRANDGDYLTNDIHGLAAVYDSHAEVLSAWIRSNLANPYAKIVVATATNDNLTDNQAAALDTLLENLDGDQLQSLVEALSSLNTWALVQPQLAQDITAQARHTGVYEQLRPRIQKAMRPTTWGITDGVSEELNSALTHAQNAARQVSDPDLRSDYEAARTELQSMIDEERREHDEEVDDGW